MALRTTTEDSSRSTNDAGPSEPLNKKVRQKTMTNKPWFYVPKLGLPIISSIYLGAFDSSIF